MNIKVRVYRGDKLVETINRIVQVHKRDQKWTVSYKGKRIQVFGSDSGPYYINLPLVHNKGCELGVNWKDCPACIKAHKENK